MAYENHNIIIQSLFNGYIRFVHQKPLAVWNIVFVCILIRYFSFIMLPLIYYINNDNNGIWIIIIWFFFSFSFLWYLNENLLKKTASISSEPYSILTITVICWINLDMECDYYYYSSSFEWNLHFSISMWKEDQVELSGIYAT